MIVLAGVYIVRIYIRRMAVLQTDSKHNINRAKRAPTLQAQHSTPKNPNPKTQTLIQASPYPSPLKNCACCHLSQVQSQNFQLLLSPDREVKAKT